MTADRTNLRLAIDSIVFLLQLRYTGPHHPAQPLIHHDLLDR